MKFTTFIFLITCTLLFINCDEKTPAEEIEEVQEELENEEPQEITYFTFKPYESLNTTETDDWLIIHDQSGKLLDYRLYESNDKLLFKAIDTSLTNSENLVITFLTARDGENTNRYSLKTYTDIVKGFTWNTEIEENGFYAENVKEFIKPKHLGVHKAEASSKAGTYNLTVTNLPGILKYNITSAATGVVTADYNPLESNVLSLDSLELLPGINYIFFIGDALGGLKYTFFEVIEETGDLVLSYDDFIDFEQIIETELPPNSYLFSVSRGFENAENLGRGYEMTVELDFMNPTVSKIGHVPGYESYSTVFQINLNSGYAYQYYEQSAVPLQEINILDKPSFLVQNKELKSFNFSTDIDFIRTGSTWKYEENFPDGTYQYIVWDVHSTNKNSHIVGDLPEEIITTYPKFELTKTQHYSTYLTIRGRTYETLLNNLSNPFNSVQQPLVETIILYPSQD